MTSRDKLGAPFTLGPDIVADGDSTVLNCRGGEAVRIVITELAGGTADIQPQGSNTPPAADGLIVNPYPMGAVKALAANETWTRWVGEPNSYVGVNVANVAVATVRVEVQRFGA